MLVGSWKTDFFKGKADAQKVAEEISSIGDSVSPEQIVDFARDEGTELHKLFEWDDTKAAELYRRGQARNILCSIVIVENDPQKPAWPPVRYFHKENKDYSGGYKQTITILQNDEGHRNLLEQAMMELRAFKKKYHMLEELSEIFALID